MAAILGNHIYPNLKYEKVLFEVTYEITTWLQMAVYRRQLNHHLQLGITDINLNDMQGYKKSYPRKP